MKKGLVLPAAFFLVSIGITLIPFLKPGLFDVHDPTSAFRLYTLVQTLNAGQFPAAWSNLLNFGFGYPLFLYYAPLFGYLGALVLPLVHSYELAIKVALLLASVVGTCGMYCLLRRYGKYPAILGSIAYTFLPYRASALYVRGSYAEFLGMSLLPWVLYVWSLPQRGRKVVAGTALVTALFALAHNTLPVLIAPMLCLMIVLWQRKNLRGTLLTLAVTGCLAAWFIFPVLLEKSLVQVDTIARLTNFHDHFVTLSQLWYSPWGYGGSAAGVANDHMSFMIGKGQVLLAILGLAALAWQRRWRLLILSVFTCLLSIYLLLKSSTLLWEHVSLLSIMQFPWRSLAVLGIGVSVLTGCSVLLVPKKWQLPVTAILCLLLIATNWSYFRPQEYRMYNGDIVASQGNLDPLVRDKIPEYLPSAMPNFPGSRKDDGLTRSATAVYGTITLPDTSPLIINTAYMPQWRLTLNGLESGGLKASSEGLVETVNDVRAGANTISLTWHRTLIENTSLLLSIISLCVVIGLLAL